MDERRKCDCGISQQPKQYGNRQDGIYIGCPVCGCRTETFAFESAAWRAWERREFAKLDPNNISIYEMMREAD